MIAIILTALLVVGVYWWRSEKLTGGPLPPGPKGVPIFGNLLSLMWASLKGEAPFVTLGNWGKEYGPLCYLRFASQRVIVVSDAQIAQQMCVKQAENFSERPPGLFVARVLKGTGIVFNDGPSWKAHRVFIQQELRKFGCSRQSIETPIQHVADELVQQFKKVEGQVHDPHLNFATATYNVIWHIISGQRFQWDDPFLGKLIRNLDTNLEAMELVGSHNYITLFMLLQMIRHGVFQLRAITKERFEYFSQLISGCKEMRANSPLEQEDSMVSDYLELLTKPDRPVYYSESQLLSLISDLFIAGGETTITTLRWSVLCLALNPHVQERIRNEMKEVVGMDSPPSYSQREELPYFEATMYEILRFCGVTPGMWRNTTNDTTVNGFFIPKGTWVLLHFYAMSRKEEDWKDAHLFRPERFLDEQGAFQKNENFLVFSTGRRHCPGETLAKTELFTLVANILQKFKITLADSEKPIDLSDGVFGITYAPPNFKIILNSINE